MARIAGVNIPTHKRVPIALTYITGIGQASAKSISEAVGIDPSAYTSVIVWCETFGEFITSAEYKP